MIEIAKISDVEEQITTTTIINSTFTILSAALICLLILGISFFYSGLTQRKSSFQQLSFPLIITSEILILWLSFGFSLSFSETGSSLYLGNFKYIGLRGLIDSIVYPTSRSNDGVIALLFALYHGLFASVAATLSMGCVAERGRLKPAILFTVCWLFLVYCPVSYWIWNGNGWINKKLHNLDFAGGDVVHVTSGMTAFVYSWFLGARSELNLINYRASSSGYVVIGTMFMAIGWIGFNSGSLFTVNLLTGSIICNTFNSMAMGGFSWLLVDYFYGPKRKISIVGFCSGCVAGLACVTPGTAYVSFWSSFIFGIAGGTLCNFSTRLKYVFRIDDSCDIAAIHLIGGFTGALLTGLFADKNVASIGNIDIKGGWINRRFIQLLEQFLASLSTMAYTFGICFVLLFIIDRIPGCTLRVDFDSELNGLDASQLGGEYVTDYVEFLRQLNPKDFLEEAEEETTFSAKND